MNPKLIVIAGTLKGAIFEIEDEEVTLGRDASNRVRLVDPSVSRRHSSVKKEGEQFKIKDLDSFNGTFVNGVPVSEQPLEHGDQIAIGNVLLLFLLREAEELLPRVQFDEGQLVTQSTMRLLREDALYLKPEKMLSALPPTSRIVRDLNTLLKISAVINSVHGLEALQRRLIELILEIVPAERGAILLIGSDSEEFTTSVCWSRLAGQAEPIRVSRTIIEQALRESAAILCNDISTGEAQAPAESLVTSDAHALICVPLVALEKNIGVIYLDTSDVSISFDSHHLQLLTATAGIAAIALENMQNIEWLEGENQRLNQEFNITHKMVGESPRMRELYQFIAKVAPTESTVLLRGESGTGKELAARAIHMNSLRAEKPFVAINCATLTEALLESELFGHERGAFTGAVALKRGKLEVADGGAIFLDEVGELAHNIQAKLLRVLQEREFERIGGMRPIKVNLRIIAATNKNLEDAVRSGDFRQDLYYRLNVISFVTPSLRERREDIPLLTSYFAAEYSKKTRRKVVRVSAEARSYLMSYDWPGNVRELENAIERAIVMGSTEMLLSDDLPETILETATSAGAPITKFYDAVRETKRQLILNALKQSNGNYTEAAHLLGIHPNNLHRLIRNMSLRTSIGK
jgi:transcriptional regulator with GAF, ATPase, and Fis domain